MLFGNRSFPNVRGGDRDKLVMLIAGKRFEKGWNGGLGWHSAALRDVRAEDASAGVIFS